MIIAYKYSGKTREGKTQEGIVYASDQAQAFGFVKRMGVTKANISMEPGYTLSANLGGTEFNGKELARFYKVIGKRLRSGKSMVEGLESAADFIRKDPRLRSAIIAMRQFILDGSTEADSMKLAGFPNRDCLVIKATQSAGRSGDAFLSLAEELENRIKLISGIRSVFRMPIILSMIMYVFFYGAITRIAPNTQEFLKSTGMEVKMSAFNQGYFDFANMVNANPTISNFFFIAIPVSLFMMHKFGLFGVIFDKFKVVKEISTKADHASLWGSFALMYDAGLQVRETCRMLSEASGRKDSKESFEVLGRLVNMGWEPHKAMEKAGFPEFVANGYKAAYSSGNLAEGLNEMSRSLYEDVTSLTEILQENMKLISMMILSVAVGILFFVTYYPIVSSILSNV